jgi:Peptidase family M23
MPSLGDFGSQLIASLGGKPTKQSQKLFQAWQQREGGMTANSAMWNPLNLTAPGSGLPTINSVGVVSMPNKQAGLKRTADLIKSGYPAIADALRSGRVDFQDPALQADFNRWVSGQRKPGMTSYVSGVASSFGQNLPPTVPHRRGTTEAPAAAAPPPVPQRPQWDPQSYADKVLGQYASGGSVDFTQLPGVVSSSFTTPPPAAPGVAASPGGTQAPGAAPQSVQGTPIKYEGKKMILPTAWKSTHPTSGLEKEGFTHAEDIMGHPGTPVGAPEGGTIIRHGSAQGGQSIYFKADSGRTYWIGHIESDFPVGKRVERGQTIAAISSDHPRPHVHLDWSTEWGG